MGDKIAIGFIGKRKASRSGNKIAIGVLVKDAESGAEQEHGEHGHFASGSSVVPHGANQMSVAGDQIKIGDVIHHGNLLMNGGKVIQITPAAPGKEERGPRIKLEFKNGHKISNYFKPTVQYVVTRGTQAEAKTVPEKVPNQGKPAGAAKPAGEGKPNSGAAKPESAKPEATGPKIAGAVVGMKVKELQVGDTVGKVTWNIVNEGVEENDKIVGVGKPLPGGKREITVEKPDGTKKTVTLNNTLELKVSRTYNDVPPAGDQRRIPLVQVQASDGQKFGMQSVSWSDLKVGDVVRIPSNWDAKYGRQGSVTGDLIAVEDRGRGRIDYHVRDESDGKVYVKTFTEGQRFDNGTPRAAKPIEDDAAWAKYQALAADKQKAAEAQAAYDAKVAAEKAARDAVENDRRTAEVKDFTSTINAKAQELDASSPAAPYSAGDVRNGGWGMTNAQLAEIGRTSLDGATIKAVNGQGGWGAGGAINQGKFLITGTNGEELFAKAVSSGSKEIGNEVLASLIAQRIGLNYCATIPCYIDKTGANIITDSTKLPAGKTWNGVLMDRARADDGSPLKSSSQTSASTIAKSDADQMQRMALLDALIGNSDRHDGNFMFHPTAGVLPYDAGYAFGQYAHGDAGASQLINTNGYNNIAGPMNNLLGGTIKNTGIDRNSDTFRIGGSQNQAAGGVGLLPLMTDRTVNADGSVTFSPTPFASSLRDNIAAACADFQRSYEDGNRLVMPAIPGAVSSNGAGNQVSGVGYGMIAGALNQMLGGIQTTVTSAPGAKASVSDPTGTFSTMMNLSQQYAPATKSTKIAIGKIIRRQR